MILIFLLKHENFDSNILLFQDPNKHLNSTALILWTTNDETLILISSLGINMLFYVVGSSYPTTKSP
jgi:predicted nucleic acid-binding protein